jgi:hypothetical protein
LELQTKGKNFKFCEKIASLDLNITGAGIIWKGELIAMFSKSNALPPSPERLKTMVLQTTLFWSIIKQNQDFFGQNRYFAIHSEKSDMLFFPLKANDYLSDDAVLAAQVLQPYDEYRLSHEILRLVSVYQNAASFE